MVAWTFADIPAQTARIAVVTGATAGLGLETARGLAGAGASVILAGRDSEKGRRAVDTIQARHRAADVSFLHLDLASLASVAAFAARMMAEHGALDILINNAGVMSLPRRRVTKDGFEMQFGTNYLGHFALTARLLPLLRKGRDARVVSLASIAHRQGAIQFADLQAERRYRPWKVYAQSKLAMLLFAQELQRRSDANGWGLRSMPVHPGWARTELFANEPGGGGDVPLLSALAAAFAPLLAQSAASGALPALFAATAPTAVGGRYYGPDGFMELKGDVVPARIMPQGLDRAVAARLWTVSEALTGVSFRETH